MDARLDTSRTHLPHRRLHARQRAADWSPVAAWLLGLWGVGELIRWGNRWYIAEWFFADVPVQTAAEWEWRYDLLHKAHSTLVFALVLLLLAGVSAALAVAARRSLRRGGQLDVVVDPQRP